MATPAAVRESPLSSDPAAADSGPSQLRASWTPAGLGRAIDQLCLRYDLPTTEHLGWDELGDPASGDFQEAAPRLYLAAVAVCALRTTSGSPAIAFGAWSATGLAAHLAAAAPPLRLEPDLFTESPSLQVGFAADLWATPTIVLVGALPPGGRLDISSSSPLLVNPRFEELAEGTAILRAGVRPPHSSSETDALAAAPAGDMSGECAVEIRESLLLRAVGHGLDSFERETGARFLPGESMECIVEGRGAPWPGWATVVPDLPTWARSTEAFGRTQADTLALWRTLAPIPPSPPAERALQTRASLAHQLFSLTVFSPALGWAALLNATSDPSATVAAARVAGLCIAAPTVQSGSDEWEAVQDALAPTVRAPLRIIEDIASTADEIARAFRLDGPFSSIPNLGRRVPATISMPETLRRLVEVGALDALCDRELVSAKWELVSEWCRDPDTPANAEPLVEGVPLFAIPPSTELATPVAELWEQLKGDGAIQPAFDGVAFAPVNGALELKNTTPPESRPWRNADEELVVMALHAGEHLTHAVVAPPRPGEDMPRSISLQSAKSAGDRTAAVWIDTALVATPVGQVEVLVPLLGDRDRDLDRLRRTHAVLAQYPGDLQVRLSLIHGESRKDLPRLVDTKVTWSGALVDDLEVLLGPNCVRLFSGS